MSTESSSSSETNRTHVVVCGGGVIGACTAYFLASKGARVTLVERSAIACAASGKDDGFLALDWGSPRLSILSRASFHLHRYLAAELDGPRAYGYRPVDTLSLSVLPVSAPSSSSSLPAWIDGSGVGPPRTIGTVETTAQVHPQLFTRTLLSAAAARQGFEVVIGEVVRVEVSDDRATGVILEDGREIASDAVVLALGPWSGRLPIISSLFEISGLKMHSIVVRPRDPDAITPHVLFLNYKDHPEARLLDPEVYPRPTGEVYICGMSEQVEVLEDPEAVASDPLVISMLHKIAGRLSSHLKQGEAEVVAEQVCFLPCSDDGLPVIGEMPGVAKCYVATGHGVWNILNGPATGAVLAELILEGKPTTIDLSLFSPARFLQLWK